MGVREEGGEVILYPGGEATADATTIDRIILPPIRQDDVAVVCVAGCRGVGR